MIKRTATRGAAKASAKNMKRSARKGPFRLFKGILLIVIAVSALAAGICKGGEGVFFGAIFAMGFGFLSVLSVIRSN